MRIAGGLESPGVSRTHANTPWWYAAARRLELDSLEVSRSRAAPYALLLKPAASATTTARSSGGTQCHVSALHRSLLASVAQAGIKRWRWLRSQVGGASE